ncbi:MAG: TolC family protein [Sulfurovum sp.]|nr:TolC family protein [Sulfurovum sp.]
MHYYTIIIFLALSTGIFGQSEEKVMIEAYNPIGDTSTCVKDVQALLNESYQNYPSIHASKQMIFGAKAEVESAKWNYFPTFSTDFSQRSRQHGTTVRLDQPLWTGGKLDAANELAASKENEAQYTLDENAYTLAEKLLSILQNYIEADGEIKSFKEGIDQLESFSKMLERRIEAGISSEADRELLHTRITQIETDLMNAQAKHEIAKSQLKLLTGQPLQCAIGFDALRKIQQEISLDKMQENLLDNHPLLKKFEAKITMAQAEKKNAEAAIMPNVSLRAEYRQGSIYENDIEDDTMAYINVSYAPGAGLSSISNIERAKYKVLQAQDELKTKEQELTNILIADYLDYRTAKDRIQNVQKTIRSSQKVLASYIRLFIAGKRQWLDLVNMSRELTQNKILLANLKAAMISSFYRLELQTGNIDVGNERRL